MAHSPELFSRALMARSLAYLFTVGAAVGCLTLVLPHEAVVRDEPLYVLAVAATAIGLVFLRRGERIPIWGYHAAIAVGSLILALANYYVGDAAVYPILFSWTGIYAFYFFRLKEALAHLALIGVAYAAVLVLQDPSSPIVRWILALGTPAVAGLLISTLLDRVRGEANQLRESEERTRAIVENTPDPFLGVAEDGSVIYWNSAAERDFGWSAQEALGRPVADLIVAREDRAAHEERRRREFEREDGHLRASLNEVELQRKSGETFPAETKISRVRVGSKPMLACFIRDLSDREERELERQTLYRERAARAEAEQMAGIVHSLQVLIDIALSHSRLDEMLDALLPGVCQVVDAEAAAVLLAEEDGSLTLSASMFAPVGDEPLRIAPGEGLAGRVARDKEPLLVNDPDPSEIADPALRGVHSILSVPLAAGGMITGVLQVGVPEPRRFTNEDIALLGLAADRVALAIDHLRVYEREHRIAETLQRSLLPDKLPRVLGVDVAAEYQPAASEAEVGGDWYDVIPVAGRIGLVMGDIAGKGLMAASMVGRLRSSMRAYAFEGHGPAEVVERLNQMVWSEADESQMVTLLYAVLDPSDGRMEWVNAGHLPPLVVARDGSTRFLSGESSVPLGVTSFPSYETASVELDAGETVLLYTDGLVERPGELIDDGLERLAEAVRGADAAPDELCRHVLETLVPAGGVADDVALLAMRTPVLSNQLRLDVVADPGELASMRSLLRRWLSQASDDEQEISEIVTAADEAAANAVEHSGLAARGAQFEVIGAMGDGEVDITVCDDGTWRPEGGTEGGRGLVLMRGLMDSVELSPGPDGTIVRMKRRFRNGSRVE